MPLSEEEQRILHEMEQKLYEHDRAFVDRVRSRRTSGGRPLRSSLALFVVGFAIVLVAFRSSLALATCGFLLMLLAALMFERGARHGGPTQGTGDPSSPNRARPDTSVIGRRLRDRFRQQG